MQENQETELNLEISCFLNHKEFSTVAELISPNFLNLPKLKHDFFHSNFLSQKTNFYPYILDNFLNTSDNLKEAIKKIEIILTRSYKMNPIAVSATKELLTHYISFKEDIVDEIVQKCILIDIIRITSQLSDIYQTYKMTQSINRVLQEINLKEYEYISEIRHMATHKDLPSKLLTEKSVECLLLFFLENYWYKMYKSFTKMKKKNNEGTNIFSIKNMELFKEKVCFLLKDLTTEKNEEILKEIKKNVKKNNLKCAIFFSELLRNYMIEGKNKFSKELIIEIIKVDEKKSIGKIFRLPFVKYKLLKMISFSIINEDFKEIIEVFLKNFYVKNDKNMIFIKNFKEKMEENSQKIDLIKFQTEEIKSYFLS